jgi:hypothetical protein
MSEFESMADPVEEGLAANPQVGEGTPTTAPERHPFYGSLTPSEEDHDMAVDPTTVSDVSGSDVDPVAKDKLFPTTKVLGAAVSAIVLYVLNLLFGTTSTPRCARQC